MASRILCLLAVLLAATTNAFVVVPQHTAAVVKTSSTFGKPTFASTTTTTQLQLKIDPNEIKGNSNNAKGMAKGAAYGGSIAVAVLLPVAFLAWAALH